MAETHRQKPTPILRQKWSIDLKTAYDILLKAYLRDNPQAIKEIKQEGEPKNGKANL